MGSSILQKMIFLFCILSAIVAGEETLKRTSRSVEVGSVIIENKTGNVLRVHIESNLVISSFNTEQVSHNNGTSSQRGFTQAGFTTIRPRARKSVHFTLPVMNGNSLVQCSIFTKDMVKIVDGETLMNGEGYKLEQFEDGFILEPFVDEISINQCEVTCPIGPPGPPGLRGHPGRRGEAGLPGISTYCSPWNSDWKNLDIFLSGIDYVTKTLKSSKKVILVKKKTNFSVAEKVCKSICGKILLPISSAENSEAINFAIKHVGFPKYWYHGGNVWIRISDVSEEGIWRDTHDQREWHGFTNWVPTEPNDYKGKEDHATLMNKDGNSIVGTWNDVPETSDNYIMCEL